MSNLVLDDMIIDMEDIVMQNIHTDNQTCLICLEQSPNPTILQCSHQFHYKCILEWYKTVIATPDKNKCPYCRQDGGYIDKEESDKFINGIHQKQKQTYRSARCQATTAKGTKCKRPAKVDSNMCNLHI
jgi:hypothetical protein